MWQLSLSKLTCVIGHDGFNVKVLVPKIHCICTIKLHSLHIEISNKLCNNLVFCLSLETFLIRNKGCGTLGEPLAKGNKAFSWVKHLSFRIVGESVSLESRSS